METAASIQPPMLRRWCMGDGSRQNFHLRTNIKIAPIADIKRCGDLDIIIAQNAARRWTVTAMAEYIERKAAMTVPVLPKEYRTYQTSNLDDAYEAGWNDALENLRNIPAEDVLPIVRCRDCKWGQPDKLLNQHLCTRIFGCMKVREDDFCSRGVRIGGDDGRDTDNLQA